MLSMLKLGDGHMGINYMKFSVWLKYLIIKIISLRENNTFLNYLPCPKFLVQVPGISP